jgi:NADH/NAD ratio-sensing transcriptional regulator Rex
LQYLEGPEYNVLRLYDTIKRDNRHSNIQLIQTKDIQEKIFSDWSMILKDFSDLSDKTQGNGIVYSKKEFRNYLDNNEFWNKVDMVEYLSNLI